MKNAECIYTNITRILYVLYSYLDVPGKGNLKNPESLKLRTISILLLDTLFGYYSPLRGNDK